MKPTVFVDYSIQEGCFSWTSLERLPCGIDWIPTDLEKKAIACSVLVGPNHNWSEVAIRWLKQVQICKYYHQYQNIEVHVDDKFMDHLITMIQGWGGKGYACLQRICGVVEHVVAETKEIAPPELAC